MIKRHFKGWILTALVSILCLVGVGNSELYINGIKTLGDIVTGSITATAIDVDGPIVSRQYFWIEDFDDEVAAVQWEAGLNANFWITAGTNYAAANVTYTVGPGGTVDFKCAAADNDSVNTIGTPNFREAQNPIFEARIKIDDITTVHWAVGLVEGSYASNAAYDDDIVLIGQDTAVAAGNVYLITNNNNNGVEHFDTGIDAVNNTYLKVKFDCTDPTDVRIWINDTEIACTTADIQTGTTLMPYIHVQNLAGGAIQRTLTVDYVEAWQDRG